MEALYLVSGVVIKGENRGKDLGFPTANIRLHKQIPEGVYAASVTINGKEYHAATFVGSAQTFHQSQLRVESYILDYSGNLYNKWITVRLYKKMRGNKKFTSVDKLVAQMHEDVQEVKDFFVKTALV